MKRLIYTIFFCWGAQLALAQETLVSGKITDAETGDPIPFANVVFKGTQIGGTSDFDGFYKIKVNGRADSIEVSYVGYERRAKPIKAFTSQVVNVQLVPQFINLEEVVVKPGENPAWRILREVNDRKKTYDKKRLNAYEYEAYTKVEIDIDQISEKVREKKMMKKISQVLDSISVIAGEDGKPILPIFISETISRFYFRDNPKLRKEEILKTKVTGVGVNNSVAVSQLLGSTFQEYNFYNNSLNILGKNFTSPIADGWRLIYEYDLIDSLEFDGEVCYRLDFFPKNSQDLAFIGSMWITKKEYALKQIDVSITPNANINYVEKIKIQQELAPSAEGAWLPKKNRILVNIPEISENSAGMLAKFYMSTKDWVVNEAKDPKFYEQAVVVKEDAKLYEDTYWEEHRHDSLSQAEKDVYAMIDTLNNLPAVKTYVDIVETMVNGYYTWGNIDWGPYVFTYGNNNIEGHRVRVGFKTNKGFSSKWQLRAYAAYGFTDKEWKYMGGADYIISRTRWTRAGIRYTHDLDQVGLQSDELQDNNIFLTFSRFGTLTRPYMSTMGKAYFLSEFRKGITQKVTFKHEQFSPRYDFFFYKMSKEGTVVRSDDYINSEITFETRIARDEIFIQTAMDRLSMGTLKWPVLTLGYTLGIKGLLGSDFAYHKVYFNVDQTIRLGIVGRSIYAFESAYIFDALPYPLLKTHIGNESPFYTTAAFSLMNYFEFVSDAYASLRYEHHFDGFLLNRIPLMRRLKWRAVVTSNMLYGTMRQENFDLATLEVPPAEHPFMRWENKPYMEVGYGIENIFKIGRIDAFHRLTYLDRANASKFGVKVSFQFIL
ncbi:DUF5686 family protein [Cytophagales bacterium LB-30]|uniref:DUF5686 family protein n=1 Tax=Shiella aurantiaca TaxID=3058365 RepID=A0ABT8F1F9_9BACT|nr:DUF5686 family protein [Shiella aurantiaca]MDN4164081.1 DUF5686 family protein [Shiella aurantiaca]